MRHNNEPASLVQGRGLSREDFMRIYESMPKSARAQLFAGLDYKQKSRLLELLTPAAKQTEPTEVSAGPEWHAEDFLPEKDERKIARLRQLKELRELKTLFAEIEQREPLAVAEVLAFLEREVAVTRAGANARDGASAQHAASCGAATCMASERLDGGQPAQHLLHDVAVHVAEHQGFFSGLGQGGRFAESDVAFQQQLGVFDQVLASRRGQPELSVM